MTQILGFVLHWPAFTERGHLAVHYKNRCRDDCDRVTPCMQRMQPSACDVENVNEGNRGHNRVNVAGGGGGGLVG